MQVNRPSWDNANRSTSWLLGQTWLFNNFIFTVPFVTNNVAVFFPEAISYIWPKQLLIATQTFIYEYFCTRWQPNLFILGTFYYFDFICPFFGKVLIWPFIYFPFILNSGRTLILERSITDSRMPEISRHSLLEYCSLAQHFHLVTTKFSTTFTLTFLDIARSDSILVNLVFNSSNSPLTSPESYQIYGGSPKMIW